MRSLALPLSGLFKIWASLRRSLAIFLRIENSSLIVPAMVTATISCGDGHLHGSFVDSITVVEVEGTRNLLCSITITCCQNG